MRIAFDMSAFLWNALLGGKDEENGRKELHNDKEVQVNSAQYGYDIAVGVMTKAMKQFGLKPMNAILVFEGLNSKKRRQALDPSYKAQPNREHSTGQYEEFHKAKQMLRQAWLDLGAICMHQDAVEADDVLAWLARETEQDLVIATFDNDLAALNGKNAHGATIKVWINGIVGENKYGSFPYHLITTYKALVGDSSDNIKGCVGFGEKAFTDFRVKYDDDGLQDMQDLLESGKLDELHQLADETGCKLLKKICQQEDQILRCYKLAKLHPEWINTLERPLQVQPGMVRQLSLDDTDTRLKHWLGTCTLVTADNYDAMLRWAKEWIDQSPFVALDIETSTPDESDEWLERRGDIDGVDQYGSELTGMSLTFGDNMQHTVYISVDHANTNNITSEQCRAFVMAVKKHQALVIQNVNFELPILYSTWAEQMQDNGYDGFLPNVLDTKLEAAYVDENEKRGLKERSKLHLGYTQQTYDQTTKLSGRPDTLPKGGRLVREFEQTVKPAVMGTRPVVTQAPNPEGPPDSFIDVVEEEECEIEPAVTETWQERRYKMNELSAQHVFGYGCDDTICTAALHSYYRLMMELEHTWQPYLDTEIDAAYLTAAGFLQGADLSVEKLNALIKDDDKVYDEAWATVRDYLMRKGWEGTVCPEFGPPIEPSDIKMAYTIVTGKKLDTAMRKIDKIIVFIRDVAEQPTFAAVLEDGYKSGDFQRFNDYVRHHFKGEPEFNIDSFKQKQTLMYDMLGLPVVMRNKPTDAMSKAGVEGNAKTDVLAIDWALKYDVKTDEQRAVLNGLKHMQMVGTRRKLFYKPYPCLMHWKDGKVHASLKQCEANTLRASSAEPNLQQMSKHEKVEGQPPRIREVIVPHKKNAVIVSLDFKSQELVIIADYSQDANMVACFVGDNLKDMHSLTGFGIANERYPDFKWTYEGFVEIYENKEHPRNKQAKECRNTYGKKVNFTTEYGAMEEKVGQTLLIPKEQAKKFIEAKEAAFPGVRIWKDRVIQELKETGYVRTKNGAVRHLRAALTSDDAYERSKAERQGVNTLVQGSSAGQTKQAMGEMWRRRLLFKYDCAFIHPVHDEVVWSCAIDDLFEFIPDLHACMVRPFADVKIPIKSSISFGPDFGRQIEIGEVPSKEAITQGLEKLAEMMKPKQEATV